MQQRVLKVIKDNPGAENDDAKLLECYWRQVDGWVESMTLYWNLQRVTSSESITRARRKLHELGYIKYSKSADKAREDRFVEMRNENSSFKLSGKFLGNSIRG